MSPAALAEKIIEHDAVRRWRYQRLSNGGYPPSDALILSARRAVDVHRAIALLRNGCTVGVAMRILL